MSLQKFFQIIEGIDPGNIYVENIRSTLNVTTHKARIYCEMAVRDNLFQKKIGVICPNDGQIIEEYDYETDIPTKITCETCELEERYPFTFQTDQLKKIIFYRLK